MSNKIEHTPEETRAYDAIIEAMSAIQDMGLVWNIEEMVAHVHGLQHIVSQHVLHRVMPEYYSDWYSK